MCRESAGATEDLQVLLKMNRTSAGITANVQVLQKTCIKSAGITENLQGVAENLRVLHNIGKVIMPRLRYRSTKDFATKGKEK